MKKEIAVKSNPGIRKILIYDKKQNKYIESNNKKYKVTKSIKGKRIIKCFNTLREAQYWKNSFNEEGFIKKTQSMITTQQIKQSSYTLKYIAQRYKEAVYPTLEKSTCDYKEQKAKFLTLLEDEDIESITPITLDEFINHKKQTVLLTSSKRCSFDNELDELRALFNWYKENYNYRFHIPLLKRHWALGKIRNIPEKNKKMNPQEILLFFDSLKEHCNSVYYDLAITQFFTATRIQEAAGIIKDCVDLQERTLTIKNVIVWDRRTKLFDYLKPMPKNKHIKHCYINNELLEVFERRMKVTPKSCKFIFQIDGEPLIYRRIQSNYDKALKKCGLHVKFSGTHILRHSPASITRKITGSADLTQALTGHRDIRLVEHYAGSPDDKQIDAVISLEKHMKKIAESKSVHPRAPQRVS